FTSGWEVRVSLNMVLPFSEWESGVPTPSGCQTPAAVYPQGRYHRHRWLPFFQDPHIVTEDLILDGNARTNINLRIGIVGISFRIIVQRVRQQPGSCRQEQRFDQLVVQLPVEVIVGYAQQITPAPIRKLYC